MSGAEALEPSDEDPSDEEAEGLPEDISGGGASAFERRAASFSAMPFRSFLTSSTSARRSALLMFFMSVSPCGWELVNQDYCWLMMPHWRSRMVPR
jgi:hypothetical protein